MDVLGHIVIVVVVFLPRLFLLMLCLCGCFSDLQTVQVQKMEKVNLISKCLIVVTKDLSYQLDLIYDIIFHFRFR